MIYLHFGIIMPNGTHEPAKVKTSNEEKSGFKYEFFSKFLPQGNNCK